MKKIHLNLLFVFTCAINYAQNAGTHPQFSTGERITSVSSRDSSVAPQEKSKLSMGEQKTPDPRAQPSTMKPRALPELKIAEGPPK